MRDESIGSSWLNMVIVGALFFVLFFGYYKVFTDDYQYDAKDAVMAVVFFPYAMYIGVNNLFSDNTASKRYKTCMDSDEVRQLDRYRAESACRYYATHRN